jgi:hypothetical protein
MQVGVLITDGGVHPPETWAEVTANQIIDISRTAKGALLEEAEGFRSRIVQALVGYHRLVQEYEREQLSKDDRHMLSKLDPTPHIDDPVEDIVRLGRGTSFAQHLAKPETQDYLRRLVGGHFCTVMHIERLAHADQNKDHPHRRTYKEMHGLRVPEDEEGTASDEDQR